MRPAWGGDKASRHPIRHSPKHILTKNNGILFHLC